MNKDKSIADLITRLSAVLNPSLWQIVDHWEGDLLAIGFASIADATRLVYVSTRSTAPERYFYECEEPPVGEGDLPYSVVASGENATFAELVDIIRQHILQVKP